MTPPKIRVGPWDCDQALHTRIKELRMKLGGQSWTWALHQGLRLLEEKHGGIVKPAPVLPVAVSPAPMLPAAVSVAGVPVVSVPQTEAGKKVERLRDRMARAEIDLEEAKARLLIEPSHIPSQTVLRVLPARLVEDQGWLVEAEKVLALEQAEKEKTGEDEEESAN